MAIKRPKATLCEYKKNSIKNRSYKNVSSIYKYKGDYRWKNIKVEKYKVINGNWKDIVRQTLIGNHGESARFHVRYFEIASGGYSSFELHKHEHVVIGIRGKGECVIGKKRYKIGYLDIVYISPLEPHQLINPYKEPFGFLCIVNAKRDRPKIITRNL